MKIRYSNAKILRNGKFELGELWCAEGVVIAPHEVADVEVDLKGLLVVPGLIDLQVNGLLGDDLTSHPESISKVALHLLQYGVTGFLPTVISSSLENYQKIFSNLHCQRGGFHGAAVLGIHLEGPFLNPLRCGAHPLTCLKSFEFVNLFQGNEDVLSDVKMITLAPELSHADTWISQWASRGICVAAGHTDCTAEQLINSCKIGVRMVTHLFNAMTPLHHRFPGIVGSVLGERLCFYSLIVDGIHVDPFIVKMAWNAHPKGLVLISDGTSATGLEVGAHASLGEQELLKQEDRICLHGTSTLAGSGLTLDQAVRNFHRMTNCSLADAISAATIQPAKVLGIDHVKGELKITYDADFILLNDALEVRATFIAREQVWKLIKNS